MSAILEQLRNTGTIEQGLLPYPLSYSRVVELGDFNEASVVESIPPLDYALTRAQKDRDSLPMLERLRLLPQAHISPFFLESLWQGIVNNKSPHVVFRHEASQTAQEKIDILARHQSIFADQFGEAHSMPQPLKTRTAKYKIPGTSQYAYILITGIGDTRLSKEQTRAMTGTKDMTINPTEFSTGDNLGVYSGMVNPFLDPEYTRGISAIYLVHDSFDNDQPVEIAASPIDSIVVRKEDLLPFFPAHLHWSFSVQRDRQDAFTRFTLNLPEDKQTPVLAR